MTTISVAMATYNGARFLRPQLDSLAAQTRLPDELVVCDDGSADDTLAILTDFARTAPFDVRILRNDVRLGYRANFLSCAGLCRGRFIAFCDQDDIWHEDKLHLSAEAFEDPTVTLTFHNANVWRPNGDASEPLLSAPPALRGFRNAAHALYNPQGFTLVSRADLCRFGDLWPQSADHQRPHLPMAHDQWFFFVSRLLGRAVFDDRRLATYRIHDRNTFGWNNNAYRLYHHVRALAAPGVACARKLNALQTMQAIAGRIMAGGHTSSRLQEAKDELGALVDLMQTRHAMLSAATRDDRLAVMRSFLRQHGYRHSEWRERTPIDRLLSDLFFTLTGPGLERVARGAVRGSRTASAPQNRI